ncbi:hypothetical protein [uncultured Methanosphaera sp.]|uniref:hypothetical protein n=1 Tax=uncultured Methanosphaera sp. TaxID=262501 RepID=UPI00280481B6|nr:hypothetical protein [uncultured Methanosphaera sp.]
MKINGKTQKTYSITGKTTYNFTIPKTWNNREVKVLVIYGENNNYKSSRIETTTKITLPTNKTAKKEEVVNNYYVSAENGLDTNTGSQTSPFKTIQKAITTVQNNKQTANIYLDGNFKGAGNTNLTVPGDLRINFIGVGNSSIDGEVNYTLKIELDADEYYWGSSPIWRPYMNGKGNWAMNITRGNGLITVSNLTIKNCWNEGGSSISAYKTATIDNYGNLEVNNVSFIFNHGGVGAGIRNNNNATLKVVDSLFEANRKSSSTGNFGAGLYNNGIAIVINSTFQKNYARWGTVTNDKNLTIINSTIKDNIAYDGGSAYRTGSGITVNTGDADYFNPYDVENLVTIVDGCYFENNEELDLYILNGENTVINNVFNKSTGFLSSGNKTTQLNITNNTFDTPIPSSIYTSLSNKDPYLMIIKLEGSHKYIIDSNTVLNIRGTNSKALELTANNATLTNNKFTCEISVIGSDNIIKNNNITTTKNNYAILLGSNSKNNTITENYLQALAYLGNSAVNYTSITNKVENNKPDVQELKIDDETFYKFFDDDGNLLKTYNSIEQIQIIGALNNKNINLPKELIITQTGSFTSYNVTITTNSKLQIIGVTIENTNQQPALVMQNDGVVNQVNFKTNNENTIILKGENNIVENSTLLADMLVGNESVKQENTNNIITKNTPTYKNFVLSQENFNTYFNNDGTIKPLDVEEIHLLINGTIQNKDIIINTNKSVTISNYINSKLLNTTIKTENTPEIIIKGLVIENSNNKTTLDLNSQNILINNNNITTNNTQIKVTNITLITIEENNLTSNTTILDVIDATNTTINENDIKVQSTNNKIPAIKIVGEQQKTSTLMQYNTITTTSPIELENQNAYIRSNTITLTQKDATAIKAKNISTYRLYYAATYSFEYNAIILEKENSNAIIIKDTHDYRIKDNNIILYKNNSTAITLDKTNNVNITSNTISLRDDSNAIVLENVKQSRLYGNDISSTALNNKNEAFVILNNATGVTIKGNSMKTLNNYTILLNSTSKNNRIENNTLCSNQELGDKTVLNLNKIGNAVQYNTPSEITYFYLNEKTYKDYFNEKGQMTNKIKAGSTILLTGNLYNKILNITRPITLIGDGITFYNTTLIVSEDAKNSNITGISFEEKTQIIIDANNTNIQLGSIYNDAINDTPLLVVNGNNNTIKITSTTYITCKNENINNLVLIKITGNQNKLKTAMLRTTPEFNNITAIQLNNANSNNIYVQTLWLKGKHTIPVELINSNKNIFNTNQLDFYGQEENEGIVLTNSSQNIISGRISGNENYTSSMLKLQNNSNFNQIKDITIGGSSTTPIYVINSHNNTFYNGKYSYSSLVGYVINITESVGNKVEFNCIYSLNLEGDDCVIQENTNDSINNIINYNRGKQEGFTGRINMTLPSSVKVFDNIKINLTLEHHNGTSWNAPYVLIESGKVQVKINNKEVGLFDVENRTVPEITYQVQPEDGDKLVVEVIYANFDHELCNIYKNVNITVEKLDTKVLLPNTTNTNTKTTFTSMVVDEKGNIVYSGKVAYKLNGKTIGVVKIHNGIASLTVDTTKYALKDYNITAVYGGNDVCSKSTAQSILTLNKYNVNVDVSEVSTKRNSTAVFDVKLCDDEGNLIQTSGKAVLKINGKTVERINITNGVTTIKYQVPANMQNKKYNITVVTSGKTYDRTESNTTLNIVKA